MASTPSARQKGEWRQTHGEGSHKGRGHRLDTGWTDAATSPDAKGRVRQEDPPLVPRRGRGPQHWFLTSGPKSCERTISAVLSRSVCGGLLQQPQEANTA